MTDYIIVGAGSAGCVLANRLSEDAEVVLVEAGPEDHAWDFRLHMPAALSEVLASRYYNWHYESEPEPFLDGRQLYCPRGKVLGGSSAVNGMVFVRGHPGDFDRWAEEPGLEDWRHEQCLPYFQRSETVLFGDASVRGNEGPLKIGRGAMDNPLAHAWISAAEQAGYPVTDDFNGVQQEGAGPFDQTIHRGRRQNVARAYLHPIIDRASLRVINGAMTTRVLFEGDKAVGIEYLQNGKVKQLSASREVILCGGAINSPQLLMLSGIGDAAQLADYDIPTKSDLPGVGSNLQDHLEIYIQYACEKPVSIYPATQWFRKPFVGLEWLLAKTGSGATNHFEAGAFLKSHASADYPDLQFHFLPIAMDYDGKDQYQGHGFQVHVGPMKPTSRGSIRLRSADPVASPLIQFNYNESEEDQATMRAGVRLAREIVSQSAFDDFRGKELRPGIDSYSDEDIDQFVRQKGESAYHPSCTCRMGTDSDAVVDSKGRVHGVSGLRVVDASIMPDVTNGNLNAPVVMMAEKISAAIRRGS